MSESSGVSIVLGPEEEGPTSFRLEGEGTAYLPVIECLARHMPVTVRFWRGSGVEEQLLTRFGLWAGDIDGSRRVGVVQIRPS